LRNANGAAAAAPFADQKAELLERGLVEQRMALDLGLVTCRLEWGLLEGRLVGQVRVDLFVLVLGRSLCLLVFHYSSFRRRIGSGVSNY